MFGGMNTSDVKRMGHHHAPEPIHITNKIVNNLLEIINTPNGERMKFIAQESQENLIFRVIINRPDVPEILVLNQTFPGSKEYRSEFAPNEPHEFSAEFEMNFDNTRDIVPFEMHEPHGHHDHDSMSDDEHAQAHASTMPEYAKRGERPTLTQILALVLRAE